MKRMILDGEIFTRMLMGATEMLSAHAKELNDLNVFPVSDGDTGTNMTKTMEGGLSEISSSESGDVGGIFYGFARGALLGARGNSGVILSQIFAGIGEGLKKCETAGVADLIRAYRCGIARSYAAVKEPVEGTILTVFRESTEYAAEAVGEDSSVEDFFRLHVEEARRSLERTKELLPVLAEADVIDSGGAGYLCIAEGMYNILMGGSVSGSFTVRSGSIAPAVDIDRFTADSVLEFGYCTELLLRLTNAKCDTESFEVGELTEILESLGGESIVAYKTDDIVKIHVHTFTPGDVLCAAQRYGEFLTVKVENMSLGHTEKKTEKKSPKKGFSVVAVASGEGMEALFGQMGADCVINGGQTSNPSVEEFARAFEKCGTEHIIVLPNNKNVILAAKGAAELYHGDIRVIETRNFLEGYSALSVITPGITDIDAIVKSAERAANNVVAAEITRAVRDATVEGVLVSAGQYMALSGGITALSDTAEGAVMEFLGSTDTDLCEIITLFVGGSVSADDRAALTEEIEETYPDCEVIVYESGQDVYDYMVGIE